MYRFYSLNLIKSTSEFRQNLAGIALWKTAYLAGTLILPILMSPFAWWMVVLAFIAMHFVTGVTLTLVFQSAHVMPDNEYPLPDEHGELGSDKWEHQLKTTCNFAMKNRTVTWLLGGLNHQIEHHLFPHVSHVHYSEISKIVQATALEYGVPYHAYPTFSSAIKGHFSMLYKLGNTGS
jgi:linoleoyl-CoA desaturase